jgi:alpha-N-acetylglucosamine transferase
MIADPRCNTFTGIHRLRASPQTTARAVVQISARLVPKNTLHGLRLEVEKASAVSWVLSPS